MLKARDVRIVGCCIPLMATNVCDCFVVSLLAYRYEMMYQRQVTDLNMFFLGAAQRSCGGDVRLDVMLRTADYNVHSPDPARVDLALAMLPETREAFKCNPNRPFGRYELSLSDTCNKWELDDKILPEISGASDHSSTLSSAFLNAGFVLGLVMMPLFM